MAGGSELVDVELEELGKSFLPEKESLFPFIHSYFLCL